MDDRPVSAGIGRITVSEGLAFALPALVIAVCALLPVGLVLEVLSQRVSAFAFARSPVSSWISMAGMAVAAAAIIVWAMRDRPRRAAFTVAAAGVVGGVLSFAALFVLVRTEVPYIIVLVPLLALVLAVLAAVVSFRAAGAVRGRLAIAWAVGIITPFALGSPVMWLSDKAGNAGMDAIALIVLPLLGLAVWWAAVLCASVLRPRLH
jgi:hypothetical protein